MTLCKQGLDGNCGRKAVARGMCSSHRRRWLNGEPLDSPVRSYQRYGEDPDGKVVPIQTSHGLSPKRQPPFAKEYALLRSLGLR
jgi:hypothetical protein